MLGGTGTLIGPAIGAGLFLLMKNLVSSYTEHWPLVIGMIFVACFVNPALESPVQAVGVGFVYGYLLALRASARTRTPKVSKSAMSAELWSKVGDGVRW